jgi:hypothetical protein
MLPSIGSVSWYLACRRRFVIVLITRGRDGHYLSKDDAAARQRQKRLENTVICWYVQK